MKPLHAALITLAAFVISSADTTIVKDDLGYTVYLPDNWIVVELSDSQDAFFDTTGAYASRLSIVRHTRNDTDFPTPEEWTRAYFIAAKLVAEHSVEPWGAVLYYDSSQTSVQGSLWAPEMYVHYFSVDTTMESWAEYIRYTASGDYGYELYAIGDTTDMLDSLATYAAIIQNIELPGSDALIRNPARSNQLFVSREHQKIPFVVDVLGRRRSLDLWTTLPQASGLYVLPHRHRPILNLD